MKKISLLLILLLILTLLLTALTLFACGKKDSADNETKRPENDNTTSSVQSKPSDDPTLPDGSSPRYLLKVISTTDEYGNAGTYTEVNDSYTAGESVQLTATVNPGYNFVGWFIGKNCVSEELNYTFTTKEQSTVIEARYSYYTVGTYSYSDEHEKAGMYTELSNKKISLGEQVTVEATVNPGYNFEGWFIGGVCVSEELTYSFKMKESNVSLEARWNYYTVTTACWSDEEGTAGTYTKMDSRKVSIGEQVTVTAEVNKGYNFEGWFIGDVCVSEELTYSFKMKENNVYLEARWSYYTVTTECWNDDEGMAGTYPHKQEEKISVGETVTLTATVNDGYNFEGWYIGDTCVCKNLTYTFVMDKSGKTIRAEYSCYRLTVGGYLNKWDSQHEPIMEAMGTCTTLDYKKVSDGQRITLTAIPATGYTFKGWYINDVCVCTEQEYTFVMGKEDVWIDALFTYYTVNTDGYLITEFWAWDSYVSMELETYMGSYSKCAEQKVRVGDTVTLIAEAQAGYRFVGWRKPYGSALVSTDAVYSFVMGEEDISFEAVFVRENFAEL